MGSLVKKIGLCVAGLLLPALAYAQQRETVTPQFSHALPNAPGKALISASSPPPSYGGGGPQGRRGKAPV
jgi:hypothetical protein